MLQKILLTLLVLAVAISILFFFRGKASQNGAALGLQDGKLAKCSKKPNCVSSEDPSDTKHYIEPLDVSNMNHGQAWTKFKAAVEKSGGTIVNSDDHYLAATFTSGLFKFVDDFEARLHEEGSKGIIHIRSASREGYSDMGVNKKRAELVKSNF